MEARDYYYKVRVYSGRIREAMAANGLSSAAALSRASGLKQQTVGEYLRMKLSPVTKSGEWRASAKALAKGLRVTEEMLWPEHMRGSLANDVIEFMADSPARGGLEGYLPKYLGDSIDGEVVGDAEWDVDAVHRAIGGLSSREQAVIRGRFFKGKTLRVVGEDMGLSLQRVRQIESKALRKLRESYFVEGNVG